MLSQFFVILGTIIALVFLEGLLSADNALVLAVMVRHLPTKREQKRALRYGMWGAFIFRAIAVALAGQLLKFWLFKVLGGGYLVYLALRHFLSGADETDSVKSSRFGSGFWATVIAVELADIAFSIDSIVAAVGMAPAGLTDFWRLLIVYTGGVLGIITMRFVAGYFLILLERFDGLAAGAYYLVMWIGVKLILSGVHDGDKITWEIPEWLFWAIMVLIVVVSLLYKSDRKKKEERETTAEPEGGNVEMASLEEREHPSF